MNITYLKDVRFIVAIACACALIAGAYVGGMRSQSSADAFVAQAEAYMFVDDTYDIKKARSLYEQALAQDPNNEKALYNMASIYYVFGEYGQSLATAQHYAELYPENKRIHYIEGLAHAYAQQLPEAESAFQLFLDSGLSTYRGYLDIAWVQFQRGETERAEQTLHTAVSLFGDNAWLNTSLGGVSIANGKKEEARAYLQKAEEQAQNLSYAEWRANYPLSSPENVDAGIAQMRDVIAYNISLLDDAQLRSPVKIMEARFADFSPKGARFGAVVSACGDSCSSTSCVSAPNACGTVATGTLSSCGGACSAPTPVNPSGTCSVSTPCGTATGYVGCNTGCNLTHYPVCLTVDPNGDTDYGEVTWIDFAPQGGGEFGLGDIDAQLLAVPNLVFAGTQTTLRWLSVGTTQCSISGDNGDVFSNVGVAGERASGTISQETLYTLTCTGFDDTTVSDTAVVRIIPVFEEF